MWSKACVVGIQTEKWQQQQKMRNKQKLHRLLYQNYREFVEYINGLSMPTLLYLFIMYVPSFTILGDLVMHIPPTHFLRSLSILSVSSLAMSAAQELPWLTAVLLALSIVSLMLPLVLLLLVVLLALSKTNDKSVQIGHFTHIYQQSTLCALARLHKSLFQRVFLPSYVSFAAKVMLSSGDLDKVTGIVLIVLTFVNSLVFHYYSLEIGSGRTNKIEQNHINFPNVILESILVMVTIIVINLVPPMAAYVCCVCFFMARIIISHIFRFQNEKFYPQYQFSLFCANCVALAMLIGYLNEQPSIMMVCAALTVVILYKAKRNGLFTESKYSQVNTTLEIDQLSIGDVKKDLRAERIAKTFKEAVWLSRRKNSHREQLTIDIIKSKCYQLECESRGSTKVVNFLLLLEYQLKIVDIIKKTLVVQEKAIEALSILKRKQPKQQLLIKTVVQLADLISECKQVFVECVKINALAPQLTVLKHLFFKQLYNDGIFLKEIKSEYHNEASQVVYKRVQKQLFKPDSALIVVNIIDQVGKITKVSNNMLNVLGYPAHTLVGLSINELIPLSIRKVHDNIINNFLDNFTSEVMREKPSVEFFAYDKMFHLQKVQIRYKFFLHSFENFQLSSVVRKQKTDDYLILADQFGNIEGWTAQVGQLFNFDELIGNQCNSYNIMPLIPAYIKYDNRATLKIKTIFFRLSKMKHPKLMLFDMKKLKPYADQIRKKQLQTFLQLLEKGEIIEAFYVGLEINIKKLQRYDKILKLIKLTDIKRVQNFEKLENFIIEGNKDQKKQQNGQFDQFNFHPGMQPQKSFEESQDAEYSILKNNNEETLNNDMNFSLDFNKGNTVNFSDLKFNKDIERLQSIFSTRSLLKLQNEDACQDLVTINENLAIESNFEPKLQRRSSMIWLVVLITIVVTSLIIQDQVSLQQTFKQLSQNKTVLFRANRAEMVYCKSVFNPNRTYISQFDSGNLFIVSNWLMDSNTSYESDDGTVMVENEFYLLNVQIPSTLDRIAASSSQNNPHWLQMEKNFYKTVQLYEKTFDRLMNTWNVRIDEAKAQCAYKMIVYTVGALFYLAFLVCIQKNYKNQRKMTEAFFKFQREDLNCKIKSIKSITTILEKRCAEWFIDQYLNEIKKQKKEQAHADTVCLINKEAVVGMSKSQRDVSQNKSIIVGDSDIEVQIQKKRVFYIVILIIFVLATQILFLILHGVLSAQMLDSYKDALQQFDIASKLIVYPNLKMASLTYAAPPQLLEHYREHTLQTLNQPVVYMPDLYNLLAEKPCPNCTFMSQILKTNYRSFYSYFMQIIDSNLTATQFRQLYYAVDVVVEQVTKSFTTRPIPSPGPAIIVYCFSVVVFFVSVVLILRQLESEYLKLECFLKFFDMESLLKNKHMSTVMAKNM